MKKKSSLAKTIALMTLSALTTLMIAVTGYAQEPIFKLDEKKVGQIGIIVKDTEKVAKRYSEVFGIKSWRLFIFDSQNAIFHDKPLGKDIRCVVKAAMGDLGGLQIELIQPTLGPGTWGEFLEKHGEGAHHFSFGAIKDADETLARMRNAGYTIEMQGLLGDKFIYTYMSTQKDMGTRLEFLKVLPDVQSTLKPYGTLSYDQPGIVNLEGKKIMQFGIVVEDVEKAAKKYYELFGVPFYYIDFKLPHIADVIMHDKASPADIYLRGAFAVIGGIQFELLQPIHGLSTHMEFFDKHGQGIHHVSFGEVENADQILAAFRTAGYGIEMAGLLGGATTFIYMDTHKDLGTMFEILKRSPGKQSTLKRSGGYPPPKE